MAASEALPGDTPEIETVLERGELITAVTLPKPAGGFRPISPWVTPCAA